MPQTTTTTPAKAPASPLMAALPAAAILVAAPLALVAAKLLGRPEAARLFGPQGLGLAAALAGVALLASLTPDASCARRATGSGRPRLAACLGLALALAALAAGLHFYLAPRLAQAQNLAPLLDELKLPAVALFTALWAAQFGAPTRTVIARLGAALGALAVLDFLLTAIAARGLVLGGGLLTGSAPGTADALAMLLCLALCATLDDDPETAPPLAQVCRWLILAGLFAGFSRPGLATAGLLAMIGRGPFRSRLALACFCGLLIWMGLTLPLPHVAAAHEELSLSWYFAATVEALGQNPAAPFLGLPLAEPLAQAVSEEWLLPGLDVDGLGMSVAIFEIPSSALRLLAAWGALAPIAVAAAGLLLALPARSRFGYGLIAALLTGGALTPALHTPATAWGLCLCLASARWGARSQDAAPEAGL